jgi:REP element-mobilizing transposase RayT
MPRKTRIEEPGFHHIYNRGVERRVVFDDKEDKEQFLEIVCEVSNHYGFTVHTYCLMDNHYHLLLENQRENLSHGMRQINATYAQYYNKKYQRVGHLWQDRYKSWYVYDEHYLFTLFKYIEYNPITAKITQKVGSYPYTLLADMLQNRVRTCMEQSFVFTWYSETQELINALGVELHEIDYEEIIRFQKNATAYKNNPKQTESKRELKNYFKEEMERKARDEQIVKANQDGFMQSEIADYLGLSISGISRIIKKKRDDKNQ